jgi:8-oxo-dGTP pyrophosphatase MutT (NUDIX family)
MDDDDVGAHGGLLTADGPQSYALARAPRAGHVAAVPSLPDVLCEHLRTRRRIELDGEGAIVCSVLIPLVPVVATSSGRTPPGSDDDEFDVVYTLRSQDLPSHKGQVAFPGGKRDGLEESLETALRESAEEIGIVPSDVRIVGAIDDVSTMAGRFIITPWIGLLPPDCTFRAEPGEVDDIFQVRLSALGDPRYQATTKKHWGGNAFDVPIITAGRHEIWGATHEITRNFLDVVAAARRALKRISLSTE